MLDTVIIVEELVENDNVVGDVDGLNTTYTTTFNYVPGTLRLYLNGLRQRVGGGNDFTESGSNQITMNNPPLPGDVLIADYQKE